MMTFFRTLIQQIGPNKKGLIRILQVLSQPSGKAGALVSAIGGMLRLSPSQTTQITGEVILISGVVLLAIDDGTSAPGNGSTGAPPLTGPNDKETPMTTFSEALSGLTGFFQQLEGTSPELSGITSQVQTLSASFEAAAPTIATQAANAALALIPNGLGTLADPLADAVIDQAVAILLAKKSGAAQVPA